MEKVTLPKKYKYIKGVSNPKYKKYNGWHRVSYSQLTAFKSEMYKGGFITQYFEDIPDKGNVFSDFGTMCGEYLDISNQKINEYLDDQDKQALEQRIKEYPDNPEFEKEILIDLEPFGLHKTCINGYIDLFAELPSGEVLIEDFKTGGEARIKEYESENYTQIDLYCYAIHQQFGYEKFRPQVTLFLRNGNQLDKQALHFNGKTNMGLRLNGGLKTIKREFDIKKGEETIRGFVETIKTISEYYKVYNKFLKE